MLLKILGAVIVICCGILAVDRFIVRPHADQATEEDLPAIAMEMNMELAPRGQHDEAIASATLALAGATPGIDPADTVGNVFYRAGEGYELFVYEHGNERTALHTDTNRHTASVNRLGILLHWPSADLPFFTAFNNGRIVDNGREGLRDVLTAQSIERLQSFDGFTAAGGGEYLLFLSDAPGSTLMAIAEQATSPEFQPGLRNSALKVDVQRAIDIANLMNITSFPVADAYVIDIGDIDVQWEKPDLTSGIDEIAAKTQEEVAAIMAQADADAEARQVEHAKRMDQIKDAMRQRNEEALARSKERNAAILEQQRQRSAEMQQRNQERGAAAVKRSEERLEEIRRQYGIEPADSADPSAEAQQEGAEDGADSDSRF